MAVPASIHEAAQRAFNPLDLEILDAFDEMERSALTLRQLTETRSTAGALKEVKRAPAPELDTLVERYEQAGKRLCDATEASSLPEAREIARRLRRRADRLARGTEVGDHLNRRRR